MGSKLAKIVLFVALLLAVGLIAGQPLEAANGDFSLDFIAAAPYTYDHGTGGGAYDDRTIGKYDDTVEQLEGGDFACNDVATFFLTVTVDDTASAGTDGPQTIELDFSFLADTTGQSGVGVTEFIDVKVNYGPIAQWDVDGDGTLDQIGDGVGEVDSGIIDDGGSVATLLSSGLTGPAFQKGSELHGTVELTDLERNEQVVVRIDVRLECDTNPDTFPTGNLQGALTAARLTYIQGDVPVTPPQAIPGGEQTVPWKQLGNLNQLLDWGDLPDDALGLGYTFPTTFAENGPRHVFLTSGDTWLGPIRDADYDGVPDIGAAGDDNVDLSDDEDGIAPVVYQWNTVLQGAVNVNVSGANGCLYAWMDYNPTNGIFDAGDLIIYQEPVIVGNQVVYFDLSVPVPDGVPIYARFRIVPRDAQGNCTQLVTFTGPEDGGEVEDYLWFFTPTAVTLQSAETAQTAAQPLWLAVIVGALALASAVALRRRTNTI